jgi:hypothetical protein
MRDAGERIGLFSVGGAVAALGAAVVALTAIRQKPYFDADESWGQMLARLWDSPTSTVSTIAGLLPILWGSYIMARAALGSGSTSTPSNER